MPHLLPLSFSFGEESVNLCLGLLLRTSLIYVDVRQAVPATRKSLSGTLLLV